MEELEAEAEWAMEMEEHALYGHDPRLGPMQHSHHGHGHDPHPGAMRHGCPGHGIGGGSRMGGRRPRGPPSDESW